MGKEGRGGEVSANQLSQRPPSRAKLRAHGIGTLALCLFGLVIYAAYALILIRLVRWALS